MRSSLVVFLVVVLVSCSPQRRLARLLEKHPLPETTDTIYNTLLVYRDTIIYQEIKGDTVRDSIFVPFEVDMPYFSLKQASTLAEATAWVHHSQLGLELIQYDSIYQFKLDSAIRESADTVRIVSVKLVPEYIKQSSFWKHGFLVLAGLILIGLLLFFVFRK